MENSKERIRRLMNKAKTLPESMTLEIEAGDLMTLINLVRAVETERREIKEVRENVDNCLEVLGVRL